MIIHNHRNRSEILHIFPYQSKNSDENGCKHKLLFIKNIDQGNTLLFCINLKFEKRHQNVQEIWYQETKVPNIFKKPSFAVEKGLNQLVQTVNDDMHDADTDDEQEFSGNDGIVCVTQV